MDSRPTGWTCIILRESWSGLGLFRQPPATKAARSISLDVIACPVPTRWWCLASPLPARARKSAGNRSICKSNSQPQITERADAFPLLPCRSSCPYRQTQTAVSTRNQETSVRKAGGTAVGAAGRGPRSEELLFSACEELPSGRDHFVLRGAYAGFWTRKRQARGSLGDARDFCRRRSERSECGDRGSGGGADFYHPHPWAGFSARDVPGYAF